MNSMYAEIDLIPLSALQHYMFCPRQCALIHVEQIWKENLYTAEGRILHESVDVGGAEKRKDIKRTCGLMIRSLRLGLTGKTDVVEFYRQPDNRWQPYPVEHKRGRRKREPWDRVQVCAQALCLEEMLGEHVPEGALFYGKEQRRERVVFDPELRRQTEEVAAAVHQLVSKEQSPCPVYSRKCDRCSMLSVCLPRALGGNRPNRVSGYLRKMTAEP